VALPRLCIGKLSLPLLRGGATSRACISSRDSQIAREVLLPREHGLIVISTYARRSNWLRSIEHDHRFYASFVVLMFALIYTLPQRSGVGVALHYLRRQYTRSDTGTSS